MRDVAARDSTPQFPDFSLFHILKNGSSNTLPIFTTVESATMQQGTTSPLAAIYALRQGQMAVVAGEIAGIDRLDVDSVGKVRNSFQFETLRDPAPQRKAQPGQPS